VGGAEAPEASWVRDAPGSTLRSTCLCCCGVFGSVGVGAGCAATDQPPTAAADTGQG
jgi:hypothetical protein